MTKINRTKTAATRVATKGKTKVAAPVAVKKLPTVVAEDAYKSATDASFRTNGTKIAKTVKVGNDRSKKPVKTDAVEFGPPLSTGKGKKPVAGKKVAATKPATEKGAVGRKSAHAGKSIVATVKDNPLREGSTRRAAFDAILKAGKTGITYEDYRAAGHGVLDLQIVLDREYAITK